MWITSINEKPEWARAISDKIWHNKWSNQFTFDMGDPGDDRQGGVWKRIRATLSGYSIKLRKYTKLKQA